MIYVMSGGGAKLFAAIGVTYPAGSTLTCTKGTKTLKAKNTSGQWVFAIPDAGTWTVTATDGTNTKSQSVSITSEGQFESVTLSYQLHLFEVGAGLASGYKLKHTGGGSSKANTTQITLNTAGTSANSQTYISPAIDCSQYSRASFTACRTKTQDMYSSFDIGLAQTPPSDDKAPNFAVYARVEGEEETFSLDLSSINETLYFCMAANRDTAGYITDILFE